MKNQVVLCPSRIIFNFLEKCNMNCPFCYCHFDGRKTDFGTWKSIVDHAHDWGVESITFGGGDPFSYPGFPKLLRHTFEKFEKRIFIQVDTNGLSLNREHFPVIVDTVSLLGLPLEGSVPEINQGVRNHSRHFQVVLGLLEVLRGFDINVKINTLVCQKNIRDLDNIGTLIAKFPVKIWSLYEFWPLGERAFNNRDEYEIGHDLFLKKAESLRKKHKSIKVEIGSIDERKDAYFFVSQTGRAYAVRSDEPTQYVELGSIFDRCVLAKWNNHSDYDKNKMRFALRCGI